MTIEQLRDRYYNYIYNRIINNERDKSNRKIIHFYNFLDLILNEPYELPEP